MTTVEILFFLIIIVLALAILYWIKKITVIVNQLMPQYEVEIARLDESEQRLRVSRDYNLALMRFAARLSVLNVAALFWFLWKSFGPENRVAFDFRWSSHAIFCIFTFLVGVMDWYLSRYGYFAKTARKSGVFIWGNRERWIDWGFVLLIFGLTASLCVQLVVPAIGAVYIASAVVVIITLFKWGVEGSGT